MTFWDHLEELRWGILRSIIVVCVFTIAAFCFKDTLFNIVLHPAHGAPLINTALTRQLMVHVELSLIVGTLLASPWILIEIIRFVLPALYDNERKFLFPLVVGGYLMFALGGVLSYFVIFPLMFDVLATYQVSPNIPNYITLDSYVTALTQLCLWMGISFELPVVCWLLGRMKLLRRSWLRRYRRHAIVLILTAAAIITPTTDIVTLLLVSVPLFFLYEFSIYLTPNDTSHS